MAGLNKVTLIGNLGRDPELRYTANGQAVANFTLATTESFSKRDGGRDEKTEWHRIVAWGKLAEICGEYMAKGRQIYVEGRIQTREWEDKDGNKRQTTEVVAQQVTFIGGRGEGGGRPGDTGAPTPPAPAASGGSGDDIPF